MYTFSGIERSAQYSVDLSIVENASSMNRKVFQHPNDSVLSHSVLDLLSDRAYVLITCNHFYIITVLNTLRNITQSVLIDDVCKYDL